MPGCAAIANPIAPVTVTSAPCQEVVITGDDAARAERRPASLAGADLDAGLRRRAVSHRDLVHHDGSRDRRPQHGHLSRALKATDRLGVRMAARIGGAGGYLHWQKYHKLKKPMPMRHRGRLRAGRGLHRAAETADRSRRDGSRRRARRRADPRRQGRHASISKCRPTPRSWSRA